MLHCDLRLRWKVASDLRFRAAISEPKTSSFCGILWRFGSVNAEIAGDCDCAILVHFQARAPGAVGDGDREDISFTWPQLGPFFVPAWPPSTAINGH